MQWLEKKLFREILGLKKQMEDLKEVTENFI
jgi:hypothetical protein